MQRRDFVAALLGLATVQPVCAQQARAVGRIGLLDPGLPHLFAAFRDGMRELGYVEGQSVEFLHRSANGQADAIPALAHELAGENVDVIVTAGPQAVRSMAKATSATPIVFAALGDALGTGLVDTLARPGRNLTGFSFLNTEMSAKRIELLTQAIPDARRIAVFYDPSSNPASLDATEEAARRLGLEVRVFPVSSSAAFEDSFRAAVESSARALDVLASPFFNSHRVRLVELAAEHRVPAMYETAEYVQSGGLMAYGPSLPELFRKAATYVDKILRGAKPSDLPVEQPTLIHVGTEHEDRTNAGPRHSRICPRPRRRGD